MYQSKHGSYILHSIKTQEKLTICGAVHQFLIGFKKFFWLVMREALYK